MSINWRTVWKVCSLGHLLLFMAYSAILVKSQPFWPGFTHLLRLQDCRLFKNYINYYFTNLDYLQQMAYLRNYFLKTCFITLSKETYTLNARTASMKTGPVLLPPQLQRGTSGSRKWFLFLSLHMEHFQASFLKVQVKVKETGNCMILIKIPLVCLSSCSQKGH